MASFEIRFRDSADVGEKPYVGRYIAESLEFEIRNSDDGGFSCELPLGVTQTDGVTPLQTLSFGPKRTHWELWRTGSSLTPKMLSAGILTSVNLNGNRDSVLVQGRDWIWYLKQRVYPFDPQAYVHGVEANEQHWSHWPKRWPVGVSGGDTNPVEVTTILKDLLDSMKTGVAIDSQTGTRPTELALGSLPFDYTIPDMGVTTKYKIFPGDSTTIFDHINKVSERVDGFEFAMAPEDRLFRIWHPRYDVTPGFAVYDFEHIDGYDANIPAEQQVMEGYGQIVEVDWTNDGPDGTYLVGLGTRAQRVGQLWTYEPSLREFGRLDLVYDFGELSNEDFLLQMLKDQNDLHPQEKIEITLLNPEFLNPSFYTGGRPGNLIGNRIYLKLGFQPYRTVERFCRINDIRWRVDQSGNELVTLGLEIVYDP